MARVTFSRRSLVGVALLGSRERHERVERAPLVEVDEVGACHLRCPGGGAGIGRTAGDRLEAEDRAEQLRPPAVVLERRVDDVHLVDEVAEVVVGDHDPAVAVGVGLLVDLGIVAEVEKLLDLRGGVGELLPGRRLEADARLARRGGARAMPRG